jgi:6-phosphogluconolactonase (cycloisomerase 2 family)
MSPADLSGKLPFECRNLSKATLVYVGTRGPKSKGIYFYRLQTDNLEVSQNITVVPLELAAETPNPNFIELDVKRRLLFAATRVDHFAGKSTGAPARATWHSSPMLASHMR